MRRLHARAPLIGGCREGGISENRLLVAATVLNFMPQARCHDSCQVMILAKCGDMVLGLAPALSIIVAATGAQQSSKQHPNIMLFVLPVSVSVSLLSLLSLCVSAFAPLVITSGSQNGAHGAAHCHAACYFMLRHAHNLVCDHMNMHADGAGQHAPPPVIL